MKKCKICLINKKDEYFLYQKRTCRSCNFLKNKKIEIYKNWSINEYIIILDLVLSNRIKIVNDLVQYLQNKNINDIVELLRDKLKIENKKLDFKTRCATCNKDLYIKLCFTKNINNFCNSKCYWQNRKINDVYKQPKDRILKKCSNCGLEINIIKSKLNVNRFGDNHIFCSRKCYYDFSSKYYVNEKSSVKGLRLTKKQRNQCRINAVKKYENGIFDRETKPQIKINELLKTFKISYQREYNCKYYSIDTYLIEYNLMIEIMGDYFHCHPLKYKEYNNMQNKNCRIDKSKHTYIKRYKNIEILYLWESDINNNIKLCEKLIFRYIKNKGILKNYHSFNYVLKNNKLYLNKNIIKHLF